MSAAVFWDRDNTLVRDPGYISDPAMVELLPGAAEALKRLSAAGFENVVCTNQSGIARGMFDESTLERIHDRMVALFAQEGARIDAIYYCPYLAGEEATVERYRQDSDLRKPKPGMILKASLERHIDLAASWAIGDSLHDVQAGKAAGCRTILIRPESAGDEPPRRGADADFLAASPTEAADIVLKYTRTAGARSTTTPPPATAAEPPTDKDPASAVLQEILSFLRTVDRRNQAEEFSLAKLAGAVLQLVAVGALIWAMFSIIRGLTYADSLIRLMLGVLLQLMALTCFVLAKRS
jgi:D-glycero-D-manno-heptose 1,7-bisphosphate phosphatase